MSARFPTFAPRLVPLLMALALAAPALPAAAQTQLEMNEQARAAAMKDDAALNRGYKALMARLAPSQKQLLTKAELKWIAFRDAECTFEEDKYRGGSIRPVIYWGAYARMTNARLAQLQATGVGKPDPTADKALNRLYQELRGGLDPTGKQLLLAAQVAWLAFRDAEADFQAARFKAPRAAAIDGLTRARNRELQMEINAGEEQP